MKAILLPWPALLVATAAAAAPAPAVTIELRPQLHAAGPVVTLGQLARLESPDLALLRRLVDLPIGRAPAAGDSALVEREALAGWLRRRLGLEQPHIEWKGPAASRVASPTRLVAGDDIAAAAATALHQWLASRSLRSEASLAGTPRDVEAVQGELRLQPRALGQTPLRSRMTVWVEVWVGERFVRMVPVTFAVAAWGEGLAALQPLAGGALLQGASLPREIDLLAGGGAPVASDQGLRVRRPVAAGEALRQDQVEPLPAVLRGEWASLRSGAGAVHTQARVQVLQDGRVGDNVRVRHPAAGPSLVARVTGTGQLEVAR